MQLCSLRLNWEVTMPIRVKSRKQPGADDPPRSPSPMGQRFDACKLPDIRDDDSFREMIKKLSVYVGSWQILDSSMKYHVQPLTTFLAATLMRWLCFRSPLNNCGQPVPARACATWLSISAWNAHILPSSMPSCKSIDRMGPSARPGPQHAYPVGRLRRTDPQRLHIWVYVFTLQDEA